MKKKVILLAAFFSVSANMLMAQVDPAKQTPQSSETWSPVPRVVKPGEICTKIGTGYQAPADAIILFDGKNADAWKSTDGSGKAKWLVADNALTVARKTGNIQTVKEFGDLQLHIEFRTPSPAEGTGQARGNSGVFLQGIYELQILDNYENTTYSNGQAGSIYKQTMPLVNACLKPGEWQTYDVIYTAPKFNNDGMMLTPPFVTVLQNGILIQNHTAIQGTTPYIGRPEWKAHDKGPIMLQDHDNLTSFRNIWIREL